MDERQTPACPISRRDFIKTTAFLGGTSLFATLTGNSGWAGPVNGEAGSEYPLADPENILYTSCLQCTVACSIKVKTTNGIAAKIDGNPYSAMNLAHNIPYATPPQQATIIDGKVCPKGQAGIQHAYDPYRLRKVLKRNGPRGSGKWITIPFDQAVNEIVNGGKLFAHIGEDRHVEGLKDIAVLQDTKVSASMAADIANMRKKKFTVAQFKEKYKDHLDKLINPDHPDMGPKNNQFLFQVGRIHDGRIQFTKRFVNNALGSVNWIEKTTLCGQTSNKCWVFSTMAYKDGNWSGGVKSPRPDHWNTEFLLAFGTIIFEANYGPVQQSEPITEGLSTGRLKMAVVDPRCTKAASKAWKWVPIKPGTDAALALGMIRWMMDNNRIDKKFLANATMAAAKATGEPGVSNSTYLVKITADGRAEKQLRASELGIGTADQFVVLQNGEPVAVNPTDANTPIYGDLFVDQEIQGIKVKSPLQLIKEEVFSRTLEQWAQIAGVDVKHIVELATEFTSHGKRAAAEFYRGAIKHTNGWYNAQAIIALNWLVGNPDWKGGVSKPGGIHDIMGGANGHPYSLLKMAPKKLSQFGIPITKEGWQYEESTLFVGYPAKRPWYPFSGNVAQETWPAVNDGYPYPIKAAILTIHSPMYSIPGGQAQLKTLLSPEKLPLFIACDIVIGDTSQYADYIFPDITYLERWCLPGQSHHVRVKATNIRQPVIAPIPEDVTVFGRKMPISIEALMLAIAEKMKSPAFGKDALGPGMDLYSMEDWYLKAVANVALGSKPGDAVPEASDEELELFRKARRHLPESIFHEERWKQALRPEEWRKVVFTLNRGGRFDAFDKGYDGNFIKSKLGGVYRLYLEEMASSRHAMSGKHFSGYPIFQEIQDSMGKLIKDKGDLHLITHKEVYGTQSRTISNYWAQIGIAPENYVVMNNRDAGRLGLKSGDEVVMSSVSNPDGIHLIDDKKTRPVRGKVKAIEGIRPGVVAVSTCYGHWGYGAVDVNVDGVVVKGDERRAKGIHPQPVFRLDDNLRGTPLSEPIGGSVSFYDTMVTIKRV